MSAPVVWIIIPGGVAILLFMLSRWERIIHLLGIITVLILALLAWLMPIDQPIILGIPGVPAFRLGESFPIFGQEFIITAQSQPALVLIYLAISMWFGGAYIAGVNRLFIPSGLAIAALLTASITIQPRTFSILLVEMVALICVPILSPPGKPVPRGVLRFLIFQTLGMMLIMIADWMLRSTSINLEDLNSQTYAFFLLGLGFALIMGIFPFHTWFPMVAEESHPYSAAFVFFIFPTSISFLVLSYLSHYFNSGLAPLINSALAWGGLLMVLVGGTWSLFAKHLGRKLGFAVLTQIGIGLLAISVIGMVPRGSVVAGIFFALLFPQLVGFAVWALSLSAILSRVSDLGFQSVRGIAYQMPIAAACLGFASLSLSGAPLFASFPGFIALWSTLVSLRPVIAMGALAGCVLLFASSLQTVAVLVMSAEPADWKFSERGSKPVLLLVGTLTLIILGTQPQLYMGVLTNLASIFITTGP